MRNKKHGTANAIKNSHALFETRETHLKDQQWLAGDHATIADIADYTYIAHAPEGNVSLNAYPNIRTWLQRVETLPGFIPMQATEVGLAA